MVESALDDHNALNPDRDPNEVMSASLTPPVSRSSPGNFSGAASKEPSRLQRVSTKLVVDGEDDDVGIGRQREFVDMAPVVFKYIRNHVLGISDDSYNKSVIPRSKYAQRNVLDAKYGEGKSGAFFYFTHDSRFLVRLNSAASGQKSSSDFDSSGRPLIENILSSGGDWNESMRDLELTEIMDEMNTLDRRLSATESEQPPRRGSHLFNTESIVDATQEELDEGTLALQKEISLLRKMTEEPEVEQRDDD